MSSVELSRPTQATIKRLFAHSANRCPFPKCASALVFGESVVGEICHIEADRPGGPRYNANQSPAERQSYENLILMCPAHHKVVDDDEETYTVERLKAMKAKHEANAGTLDDAEASSGAMLLLSVNQSGGVAAQSIGVVNVYHGATHQAELPQAPTSAGMAFFQPGEVLASVGQPGEQEFTFDTERFVYMRLIPAPLDARVVGLPLVREVFNGGRVRPLSMQWSGARFWRNQHGAIAYLPQGSHHIEALTEGMASGELWGMNATLISRARSPLQVPTEDRVFFIPSVSMEKMYAAVLRNYVRVATELFGLSLPYTIEFGAKGLQGALATFPEHPFGREEGPIYQDAFRKRFQLASPDEGAINDVLRSFFNAFYEELLGIRRAEVFEEDFLRANELPSL